MENTFTSSSRKRIMKILKISVLIILILFSMLAVHIYQVTKPRQLDNNNLQLSRIDFLQPVDEAEAAKIRHFVASLPGADNTLFNTQNAVLIYGYQNNLQNSTDVFTKLIAFGHYKAKKFIVSEQQASSGCPVMNRNSFVY